ncbi:hypothetical protein FJT64_001454 [Amphibalanus amphitrite]|uniref:Uncharacterized protein n=1 Tax=Amphibalanus amphitrite TaxID=1232801 RepID=A0A6A4V8K9_AMPAM|nr:hypothetical protein FJT64_001454 [Amphibalanus amphitrite]
MISIAAIAAAAARGERFDPVAYAKAASAAAAADPPAPQLSADPFQVAAQTPLNAYEPAPQKAAQFQVPVAPTLPPTTTTTTTTTTDDDPGAGGGPGGGQSVPGGRLRSWRPAPTTTPATRSTTTS